MVDLALTIGWTRIHNFIAVDQDKTTTQHSTLVLSGSLDTSTISALQLVNGQKSKCSLQYWIMFLLLDWKQVLDGSFCSWLEASIGSCSSTAPQSPRSSSSWRTQGRWCSHRPGCCCTLIQGILYLNKNPKSRWGPYRLLHFVFSHSSCVILIIIITASLADPDPDIFSLQMSIGSSFLLFLTCMNPLPTIESLQMWQKKHSLCQASVSKATNLVLPSPPLPELMYD